MQADKEIPLHLLTPVLVLLVIEILVKWFELDLVDALTPFLYPLLLIVIYASIAVMLIVTIITCCIKRKEFISRKFWLPLLFVIIAVLLIFAPLGNIADSIRFYVLHDQYETAAREALGGEYGDISENGMVKLPASCRGLSRGGGEVCVFKDGENGAVFFFKFRGVLDNFSGYAYLTNESSGYLLDEFGDWGDKKKITDNWYCYYSW